MPGDPGKRKERRKLAKIKVNMKTGPTMEQIIDAGKTWDAQSQLYRMAHDLERKVEALNAARMALLNAAEAVEKNVGDQSDNGVAKGMRAMIEKTITQMARLRGRAQVLYKQRYDLGKRVEALDGWFNVCECGLHTPVSMLKFKDGLVSCDGNPWNKGGHKEEQFVKMHLIYRPQQAAYKGA